MDIIGLRKMTCSDCGQTCYVNAVSGQKLKLHNVFLPNDARILTGQEAYVPHVCGACARCGADPNAMLPEPAFDVSEIAEEVLIAFARDVGLPGLAELPLEQLRAELVAEVLRLRSSAKSAASEKPAKAKKTPEQKRRELAAQGGGRCPHDMLPQACSTCSPVAGATRTSSQPRAERATAGNDPA